MPIPIPSPVELAGLALIAAAVLSLRVWVRKRPWAALTRTYPHPGAFPEPSINLLGAEINGLVPREGVVVAADDRGLHLASAGLRHRALVPWQAIRADVWQEGEPEGKLEGKLDDHLAGDLEGKPERKPEGKPEGKPQSSRPVARAIASRHAGGGLPASLMFGPDADQWLYLPLPAARELAALAGEYWPGGPRLADAH